MSEFYRKQISFKPKQHPLVLKIQPEEFELNSEISKQKLQDEESALYYNKRAKAYCCI